MKTLRPYQQKAVDHLKKRLKEVTHPLLMTMSVGAGKSLCISELLHWVSQSGYKALCLTLNSTLIKQNAQTHNLQNRDCGIYAAALNSKSCEELVIFGSPNSVCQDIRKKKKISAEKFNIIVVDECHQISQNPSSMYQRIFNHYGLMAQQEQYSYRIVGFTGTPFRDKNESICGENAFFKEEICNISTAQLIKEGFLVNPHFGRILSGSFDFSKVKIANTGKFNQKQLKEITDKNIRLTGQIMQELQNIECNGMFVFCSTISHCYEALRSLPPTTSAVIVGDTPHEERQEILAKAQTGEIKYLVSVSILMVGVDCPYYDYCAWLRPTESLILFTQGIGRVLRLHPTKTQATVLDFAGNLERFQDLDNPIINEANAPKGGDEAEFIIQCYTCNTLNRLTARRCVGILDDKRCDYYFEFKACQVCEVENDVTARYCRACEAELIDPNAKLSLETIAATESITRAEYWVTAHKAGCGSVFAILHARYYTRDGQSYLERYFTNSQKARNVAYAKFIRPAAENASDYYLEMTNYHSMQDMMTKLRCPHSIVIKHQADGEHKLVKKLFHAIE